jgi:MarR family transcriptional regulator, organic hydroperoxide resistance regulator
LYSFRKGLIISIIFPAAKAVFNLCFSFTFSSAGTMKQRRISPSPRSTSGGSRLPTDLSVGYQIRMTHRRLQRELQLRIERHGVTLGMWYYLRALWDEDGLTQRELSDRIGTMEPTTLAAIMAMQRKGFVRRSRNSEDRRKINIFLTERGRALESVLLPAAKEVVGIAVKGFAKSDVETLLHLLHAVQKNLDTLGVASEN